MVSHEPHVPRGALVQHRPGSRRGERGVRLSLGGRGSPGRPTHPREPGSGAAVSPATTTLDMHRVHRFLVFHSLLVGLRLVALFTPPPPPTRLFILPPRRLTLFTPSGTIYVVPSPVIFTIVGGFAAIYIVHPPPSRLFIYIYICIYFWLFILFPPGYLYCSPPPPPRLLTLFTTTPSRGYIVERLAAICAVNPPGLRQTSSNWSAENRGRCR